MGKRTQKPPDTASDRAERMLVASAAEKLGRGETPSAQERRALKRYEARQEQERRWQYARTTPKGMYAEMSGRATKILREQAERYGLPYPPERNAPVDLVAVARWIHDFLAANKTRLNRPEDNDPLLSGVDSPALERYRLARAQREELELAVRRGQLVNVDDLLTWFDADVAGPIRKALEVMQKQFGPPAIDPIRKALERAEVAVSARLRDG